MLAAGPYAPAAGLEGSDAISRTDPAIVGWASRVANYTPGTNVDAVWTNANNALGPAEGEFDGIVSLGRGGSLTLTFNTPIRDGLGDDFAVFENSFSDTFLELGFVEVSSDGVNFHRFASDSRTAAPLNSFDLLDPTNLHNLAGKYRAGFGTPFDLGELRGRAGLDVTAVTHIRLVDIVGDGSVTDASGDPIYDPTPTVGSAGLDVDGVAVIHAQATGEIVVDFETLGASLGGATFDNGSSGSGGFTEQEIRLNNNYSSQFQSWAGWSVSQSTDNTTPGFTNQYGAITGIGHNNSSTYAVGFFDSSPSGALPPPTITLDPASGSRFDSFYVTNTTYATFSMRQGDGFAKKFGGATGNDPDLLQLIVTGVDATGATVGTVTVDMADYRFADNSQDFILDRWTKVDVSSLSDARSLRFSMTSTDVNGFGMLTPAYIAVDDVTLSRPAVAFDLSTPVTREDQTVTGRISRSTSDNSAAITVTLNRTGSDQASVPTTVTIPAGAPFANFTITPVNDSVPTPDRFLEITASADNLLPTTRSLTIEDDESLAVAFVNANLNVNEGSGNAVSLTLTRNDSDISQPLNVTISPSVASQLTLPSTVTFAAGAREVVVPMTVLENTQLDGPRSVTVSAIVAGRATATATIQIADNDLPSLLANPTTIQLNENFASTSRNLTISRNTTDLSQPVTVTLTNLDGGPLVVPASVIIPAGSASAVATIGVIDDAIQNSRSSYRVQANNLFFVSSIIDVQVIDNDQASIELNVQDLSGQRITSIPEGTSFRVQVRRLGTALNQPQTISLNALLGGVTSDRIVGPAEVTIPVGVNQTTATFSVTPTSGAGDALPLRITASSPGVVSVFETVQVTDPDLPVLEIAVPGDALSEADAATVIDFETLGRGLLEGEFDNDAGHDDGFVSGPITLQNEFDNSFGFDSWSGFSISRDNDTQTPGFFNQYSALPGTGADGSGTYAVAFASSPVTITRETESDPFDSITVTNTTYAALSMRDGDQFAKQFGGESGDDPDFFLLTIDGLDQNGNSIGQVEFYLADVRFADNSLDYLIDQWTTVDVSSIGQAVTLSMQLSSSDNGTFGMNTPGYFAIDDVALQPTPSNAAGASFITIVRSGTDTDEPVTITLGSDRDDVVLPPSVTMSAGGDSVDVPVRWRNDEIVNGDRSVRITAEAEGFAGVARDVTLIDDDSASLTLHVSATDLSEAEGVQTIGFEDVGEALAEDAFDNGSDQRGGFRSGSLSFANEYTPAFGSWSGWAYSNVTDTVTAGFANQFASYSGGGADGSDTFAVAGGYGESPPTIELPDSFAGASFESIAITNTTYAALSMLQGDSFAKRFGGETSADPDFFLLTIVGYDAVGDSVGSVDFYLADYRFADHSLDYVIEDWTVVDLSSLVDATRLQFRLSSSDVGNFGMNTPAFFAIDQLVVDRNVDAAASMTVHRNSSDLSGNLVVNVQVDPASRLDVPATVTIPAGSDRIRVPFAVIDDAVYQVDTTVELSVAAIGFESDSQFVSVQNDELPSVVVENGGSNLVLSEGGTASVISVRLESAPSSDLTVEIIGNQDELIFDKTSLTFTPQNWNQSQAVLVSGRPDLVVDDAMVIPIVIRAIGYTSGQAWIELADYQPSRISLIDQNGQIRLVDGSKDLTFDDYPLDEDILIRLNDLPQRLTIEPIPNARGLVGIDVAGGDDVVTVLTQGFTSIDGGSGQDTLIISPFDLADGEALDLADWLRHRIVRFETIVLGSTDPNDAAFRFKLDSLELKSWLGDSPARLVTSANQVLNLSGNWQLGLPMIEDGVVTSRLVGEGVEVSVSTQRPWQNVLNRADVNGSGDVTATDALTVINWINASSTSELPTPETTADLVGRLVDVSGDGQVTAIDALQVINYLNDTSLAGEPIALATESSSAAMAVTMLEKAERATDDDETDEMRGQPQRSSVVLPVVPFRGMERVSSTVSAEFLSGESVDIALAELGLLSDSDDDLRGRWRHLLELNS
ncbi:Dockerin type I repeat protein [Neorhodopirellula pilleata]|uniref:Dockerin type I repeat protein n=2 Tax=Neorhodopirellula pilleata TaxID=2714738 RepID=A0A5C5ZZH0_9BACT|nr:Dockerin type I repeat protein [Neorhodopirellula pilleata]